MLSLRDVVEIEATPERVFDWFRHLEDNYRSWHPAHVSCSYIRGRALEDGAVLCAEEYLHGRLHRLTLTLTVVEAGREFKYRVLPGIRGRFRMRPTDRGTELIAEIFLGWSIPLIGAFIDAAIRILFSKHIEALRQHMREEDANLQAILSAERNSAR